MKLSFKNYYNYTMDFLLLYGFLLIIISSYILWLVLPMGQGLGGVVNCDRPFTGQGSAGNTMAFLGLVRRQWIDIHSWISVIIAILISIHLILHRHWIIASIKRIKEFILKHQKATLERYIAAFVLFILTLFEVLSGFVLWIIMPRGVGDLYATQAGIGRTFWGMQRNIWVDLHAWVAVFIIAIIVVHVIIHWRWITNMTIGKLRAVEYKEEVKPKRVNLLDRSKDESSTDKSYLLRAGVFIGIVGAICFSVAMLTFQLDWVGRYGFMLFFIPVPFIVLILARKWQSVSGILLMIIGIASVMLYLIFPIGIRWNQIGVWNEISWETGYTVVLVTLPLIISGIIFIVSGKK